MVRACYTEAFARWSPIWFDRMAVALSCSAHNLTDAKGATRVHTVPVAGKSSFAIPCRLRPTAVHESYEDNTGVCLIFASRARM